VPIHEVRDALGHSSTTMTSTYLRTRAGSLAKAYKQRRASRTAGFETCSVRLAFFFQPAVSVVIRKTAARNRVVIDH